MRRRISIKGCVRPSIHPSVRRSVRPSQSFSKVKRPHTRCIFSFFCRVSGLVLFCPIFFHDFFFKFFRSSQKNKNQILLQNLPTFLKLSTFFIVFLSFRFFLLKFFFFFKILKNFQVFSNFSKISPKFSKSLKYSISNFPNFFQICQS